MKIGSLSIRVKLFLSFFIITILGSLLFVGIGYRLIKNIIISQAQVKVKHDLASAWIVFNEKQNDIRDIIALNAVREGILEDLKKKRIDILLKKLSRIREQQKLDILTLTDHEGKVIVRTRNPEVVGDDQSQDEIIEWALEKGEIARPQIIPRKEIIKESQDLADQAHIEFVQTPRAVHRLEKEETSGMMLKAASPIVDENNLLCGVLYGGILLNRNYEIVDRIRDLVYKGEQYKDKEIGTATIFQGDLRISTNVRNDKNERAIGTRVSESVYHAVLKEGKPWIDKAFVVNDWYITAYEPIKNLHNEIIGILYVGLLEKPYLDAANRLILTFILLGLFCATILLITLHLLTKRIINPLQDMVAATQQIAKGDLSINIKVRTKDEIGYLADSFNQMVENLRRANEKLIEWGKKLEKNVAQRTHELKKTQANLIQAEKLASLGTLSASIAHEINNPLGAILVYGHLLLEDTDKNSPFHENLNKIIKETTRCKDIVHGLLKFARPREPEKYLANINQLVLKALTTFEHHVLFRYIKIEKFLADDLPEIVVDGSQLREVFENIILNAAESMSGKGLLTIRTALNKRDKSFDIKFSDTGEGIQQDIMKSLFEPFFSTKEAGKGTGLGLAISYGIVKKHEGRIEVKSKLGEGSTFTVKLPIKIKPKL